MKQYKMVGNHPEDLADGRILAPGEEVELSDEDLKEDHNRRLFDEGKLIDVEANLYDESAEAEPKGEPKPKGDKGGKE